jgi:hypothetical protein
MTAARTSPTLDAYLCGVTDRRPLLIVSENPPTDGSSSNRKGCTKNLRINGAEMEFHSYKRQFIARSLTSIFDGMVIRNSSLE